MKISPIPASGIPSMDGSNGNVAPGQMPQTRTITMSTNSTPLENQGFQPEPVIQNAPTAAKTQPLSPQLAQIAKQRRALQQKERELLTREKALGQPTSGSGIDIARLKSEPLSVLLENGVTYDQLTQAILNNQGNSEINALKAELASMKQGIDQKFTEKDTQAEQQVLAQMKRDAEMLVRSNPEFELVRETRSVPDVMQLIERTYRKTGEVLDVPEALKLVENELFKDAQKLMRAKKLQSQLSPMAQQQARPQQQRAYQGMRTLTNRDTASVPMSAKARAMAAFYGNLNQR